MVVKQDHQLQLKNIRIIPPFWTIMETQRHLIASSGMDDKLNYEMTSFIALLYKPRQITIF